MIGVPTGNNEWRTVLGSTSDKLTGKANQVIGKATDNKKVEAKGEAQETKGKFKEKIKDAGNAVSKKIDEVARKAHS